MVWQRRRVEEYLSHLSRLESSPCCSARLSFAVLLSKTHLFAGLPFTYLFLLAWISLALHPLPPTAEGFLRHNPRLQSWEVDGNHSATQCESGQSAVVSLSPQIVHMPTYEDTGSFFIFWLYCLCKASKSNPSLILVIIWVCFCVGVCVWYVSNLHLSLLSTSQVFRVRKQAKLQRLSVSWESGFCWAGCTGSKRRTSPGADTRRYMHTLKYGVSVEESRAKANSWEKLTASRRT